MQDTIFSKIIRREIPAEIVYEDEHTLAFLDIAPVHPGHTLVIPKTAYVNVFDVPVDTWTALFTTVHKLAPLVRDAVHATGINIMVNNGSGAGQEVGHCHIHIIPRHDNDCLKHWPGKAYEPKEMQRNADLIRAALKE